MGRKAVVWQEDYQILSELISNNVLVRPIATSYGALEATLTEIDENNEIEYSIKIKGLPEDILIIKADEFPAANDFFQGSHDECKRADYIILLHTNNRKYAVFLELKLGNPDNQSIIQQLKGAFSLFKYCQTLGKVFWQRPVFLEDYEIRFAVIKEIPNKIKLNKRRTGFRSANLAQQIPVDNAQISDLPNYCSSFQYQEEIYLRKLLNHNL